MTRVALAAALTAALWTGAASAQVSYNQPARGGGLGGGFIEFLATGRDPGRSGAADPFQQPTRRGVQAARPGVVYGGAGDPFADPFVEPAPAPRRGRHAAIAPGADLGPVSQAPRAQFRRQEVSYEGPEAPGTIVVDTPSKYLYHVLPGGRAMRYGIGVGRPGFTWAGMKTVTAKREWPDWRPPPEMRKRQPGLPLFMAGGPGNPLGARALYLGSSLYRIHGTNEPHTIGRNVSSGCIRMMNDDVIHLYGRVGVGARVKVI
ncbi:L,D-transpeptidase [Enterovirga rhinocerotis]|uniref:Lipoprotein-anchoring transpeptidase ErfK/SrfK n=1 Tax=Enterovirga rhinocerotis TaxID=1339210 RepID=A0A4R7BT12_9HYPH|nr:L,D-transpeptidase [Enterovirga rhinocerotis]TDR87146.1 lipoprotein-anchoring transpeptidase ErfK/SrfK [Enterovirga rhinocerotis]